MVFENVFVDVLGNIYIGLLGLVVLFYVILDGYDLGVGVLFFFWNEKFRDDMIVFIGFYWDVNEIWLVLVVGLLFFVFFEVYSEVL